MIQDLITAIQAFNSKLLNLPNGPLPNAPEADKLQGNTPEELKIEVDESIDEHIDEIGNPHVVDAELLDSYTKEMIDNKVNDLLPTALAPLDHVIDISGIVSSSGFELVISDNVDITWYLDAFTIGQTTIDIESIYPLDYQDNTFHLYIHITDTIAKVGEFILSTEVDLDLTLDYIKIGTIATDGIEIISVDIVEVLRIAGKYISQTDGALHIPASTGLPMNPSTYW